MFCELLTGNYGRNRQIVNQTHFPFLPKCVHLVAQACPTLCNPMHHCLPGSSVHGILRARILKWIAIPFSRGSSSPRDLLHCRQILYHLSHHGSPFFLIHRTFPYLLCSQVWSGNYTLAYRKWMANKNILHSSLSQFYHLQSI